MFQIKKRLFILSLLTFFSQPYFAQAKPDSAAGFPFVKFQYAYLFPSGDYESTFGNSNSIGGGLGYKTKSNWQFEIDAGYMFGADMKRKDLLNSIINDAGDVTDSDGELVKIIYDLRGLTILGSVGKVIPVFGVNQNSGILIKAGIGYIQHKIKVDYRDGDVFQLNEEMLKGYDRFHSGLLLNQFIGFQYFGKRNFVNFLVGIEFNQGFTTNKREYNYDTRSFDKSQKKDYLSGFRFGWIIPIKGRVSEDYYFY